MEGQQLTILATCISQHYRKLWLENPLQIPSRMVEIN